MSKICHGSESVVSRYDVVQHQYMAGESGYSEALEIKDPPRGRGRFMYHNHLAIEERSVYSEWNSLQNLLDAFETTAGLTPNAALPFLRGRPGFIRVVHVPHKEDPWFFES